MAEKKKTVEHYFEQQQTIARNINHVSLTYYKDKKHKIGQTLKNSLQNKQHNQKMNQPE